MAFECDTHRKPQVHGLAHHRRAAKPGGEYAANVVADGVTARPDPRPDRHTQAVRIAECRGGRLDYPCHDAPPARVRGRDSRRILPPDQHGQAIRGERGKCQPGPVRHQSVGWKRVAMPSRRRVNSRDRCTMDLTVEGNAARM